MSIMDFNVEETNIIAMYKADSAAATVANITAARPSMDGDIRIVAGRSAAKLVMLPEPEFAAINFTPADDTDTEGEYD